MSAEAYPVRVEASHDPRLSWWLWLLKWFLAIPHYVFERAGARCVRLVP
jgi:hypothetical protein